MPILLCSLGTSWAVVPEAFHLLPPGPSGFSAVHVLTSDSPATDTAARAVRDYFATRHPSVLLTISHVAGFADLRSADDHFLFEEVLFRWILARAPEPATRYLCLAGGFKTMSAALQRAASFLGAAEVFHVLAAPTVNTPELIDLASSSGGISFVRLGPEPGWPALTALEARDYPLEAEPLERIRALGADLSNRIADLTDAQRHLSRHFEQLDTLPFLVLATRSPSRLAWLNQAFNPASAGHLAWLAALPKIELHCHLGGFATHGPELAAIRAAASNPSALPPLRDCTPPPGWPAPAEACGLERYRHLGDNNGSALLRDLGCLRAQCHALYAHFRAQNILYAEVRCSPANYADPAANRSPWQVLADIKTAFDEAMSGAFTAPGSQPPCHVNLILIGTRQSSGDYRAGISRHLSLAIAAAEHWTDEKTCRVVGVDLAGFEEPTTRAHFFREEFTGIHRCGLALTVHAGENDDAEGIWRAVFDLNARRLGHALALRDSPDLLRTVADRAIAVEMCPYANLQIKSFALDDAVATAPAARLYPLLDYIRAGLRVTINTDNIGISAASLTDNLLLAARLCPGLTPLDILRLQRHALDAAFVSPDFRASLLARFSQAIDL